MKPFILAFGMKDLFNLFPIIPVLIIPAFNFVVDNWGSVLGVVGLILVPVVYYKQKKDREPRLFFDTNCLVSGIKQMLPSLKIKYENHGDELENVTVTRITFWNAGKQVIDKSNVRTSLRFAIQEPFKFVDIQLLKETNIENKFIVTRSVDKRSVKVEFDHIDHMEGCIIQCVHSAPTHSVISYNVKIDEGPVKLLAKPDSELRGRLVQGIARWIFVGFLFILALFNGDVDRAVYILAGLCIVFYISIFSVLWYLEEPKVPFRNHTK